MTAGEEVELWELEARLQVARDLARTGETELVRTKAAEAAQRLADEIGRAEGSASPTKMRHDVPSSEELASHGVNRARARRSK